MSATKREMELARTAEGEIARVVDYAQRAKAPCEWLIVCMAYDVDGTHAIACASSSQGEIPAYLAEIAVKTVTKGEVRMPAMKPGTKLH
jgi:hypothetical protein